MKILVIEDDPTVGQYVKRGLEQQMWGVDLVADGDEGERLAASEAYDLVILDMRLPGRSGLEVLHAIRARGYQQPVLVLTAHAEEEYLVPVVEARSTFVRATESSNSGSRQGVKERPGPPSASAHSASSSRQARPNPGTR